MGIEIENPKETFDEIAELIHLHYKISGEDIFKPDTGFIKKYPNIYRLYLQIAAAGAAIKQ